MIDYIIISVGTEDEKTDIILLEKSITELQICTQKPVTLVKEEDTYVVTLTNIKHLKRLLLKYNQQETIPNTEEKGNLEYFRDIVYKTIEKYKQQGRFNWLRITLHTYSL